MVLQKHNFIKTSKNKTCDVFEGKKSWWTAFYNNDSGAAL